MDGLSSGLWLRQGGVGKYEEVSRIFLLWKKGGSMPYFFLFLLETCKKFEVQIFIIYKGVYIFIA